MENMVEKWFNEAERNLDRALEAEQFIMNLKWWERLFINRKIIKFLESRDKYYNN